MNIRISVFQWGFKSKIFCYDDSDNQRDSDGSGQPRASPMLTAIMSGGVGISGRELYKYR